MLFSLSTLGEVAREKDVDDVESAKDAQLYDLAWKQKCPESGNWQQSTSPAAYFWNIYKYITSIYFWKLERRLLTLQERRMFSSLFLFNLCGQFLKFVPLRKLALCHFSPNTIPSSIQCMKIQPEVLLWNPWADKDSGLIRTPDRLCLSNTWFWAPCYQCPNVLRCYPE